MKTDNADKWFSIFIRLSNADENGYCKCITCGLIRHWKKLDCGHWIKRQHQTTRFNEKNCAPQCKRCNGFEQGRDIDFENYIKNKYGEQTVLMLKAGERQSYHRSKFEKELLASEYKKKAIKVAQEKGIVI